MFHDRYIVHPFLAFFFMREHDPLLVYFNLWSLDQSQHFEKSQRKKKTPSVKELTVWWGQNIDSVAVPPYGPYAMLEHNINRS